MPVRSKAEARELIWTLYESRLITGEALIELLRVVGQRDDLPQYLPEPRTITIEALVPDEHGHTVWPADDGTCAVRTAEGWFLVRETDESEAPS